MKPEIKPGYAFRLTRQNGDIVHVFVAGEDSDLTSLLNEFQSFLKAAGFSFSGHLEIVSEEDEK